MSSASTSIDPHYAQSMRPTAQPYLNADSTVVGLAAVRIDGDATIQSRDTGALRRLATALLDAADLADAITREHAVIVGATQATA